MTYDPAELLPLDVIRGLAGDTSDDPDTEILQDVQIEAIMARWGVDGETDSAGFFRAAAESVRRVAMVIEQRPTSLSSPGDGSIGWTSPASGLLKLAASLDARADALDAAASASGAWGAPITVTSRFLTGEEVEPWS